MEQRKSVFSDICLTFIGFVWFKSKCLLGAREMSQWLRAWAAFPEDLFILSVYVAARDYNSSSRGPSALFWPM